MRTAIVGSSHAAAFRLAAPEDPDVTYFATPAGATRTFEVNDGALVSTSERVRRALARSSGGPSDVHPSDFDGFAIVGLVELPHIAAIGLTHQTLRHAGGSTKLALISEACLSTAITGAVGRRSLAAATLHKLSSITQKPIVVVPSPLPSIDILNHPRHGRLWKTRQFIRDTMALYDAALDAMHPWIVRQPPDTIEDGIFTKHEFARGSQMLRETGDAHPSGECFHMNRAFGEIMLRETLDTLRRIGS